MKIALPGSSGKLGTVVVRELRSAGHEIIGLDVVGARGPGFVQVDLTGYGQVIDALTGVQDQHDGVDALVHLAAIPAPAIRSDVATFHNNITSTFNVFWAAVRLGETARRPCSARPSARPQAPRVRAAALLARRPHAVKRPVTCGG